jgi:hypothetical protein
MHTTVLLVVSLLLVLGVFLLVASSKISENLKGVDVGSKIVKANQGIFTMGIVFIVSSMAFFACNYNCNCGDMVLGSTAYMGFFLILGVTLTVLGSMVVSNISGEGKKWGTMVLVSGIVFILFCAGAFYHEHGAAIGQSYSKMKSQLASKSAAASAPAAVESPPVYGSPVAEEEKPPGGGVSEAFRFRCY